MEEIEQSSQGDTASTVHDMAKDVMAELSGDTPTPSGETQTPEPSPAATPRSSQAPAVTSQPAPTGESSPAGPIPFERHKAVLEHERREKAVLQTQVESLRDVASWKAQVEADPSALFTEVGTLLANSPQGRAFLKSQAAKWLGARETRDPATADLEPYRTPDGTGFYSEAQIQQLLNQQQERLLGEVEHTLAPIQQEREHARLTAQAENLKATVLAKATQTLTEWRKAPGWTDTTEPQIKARYQVLLQHGHDPHAALGFAYRDVVAGTLAQQGRHAAVQSTHRKLEASTISPSRPVTTRGPRSEISVRDIAREAFAEASG